MAIYVGDKRYAPYIGDKRREVRNKKALPYDAEIEYLESTGTQYIDTGIKYNSSNSYEIECGVTINSTGTFLGNGWDAGGVFGQLNGKASNGDGTPFGVTITGIPVVMTLIINAGTNTQSSLSVNVNGDVYSRNRAHGSLGTYASSSGYILFGIYSKTLVTYKIAEEASYCKIKQNGILVRDLIPVRVGTTGYLFDKLTRTLYGNAGTGDFILGNDKN